MAGQAQGAEVLQVALAAALGYGQNMVGVPEAATDIDGTKAPHGQAFPADSAAAASQLAVGVNGVGAALRTHAGVTQKHLLTQVAWIGPQPPLVDAILRAEGAPSPVEDLQLA